ncbi:RES family NAD+ phosphorylase [Ruegeria sp.]|uniref:RES family NAD+ phosphorylase n=1 Tax=Ruegeria sp. TaxID=1879320 RepID=UPI003B00CA57
MIMELPATATAAKLQICQVGTHLYRVHDERFNGNSFNPCRGDKTRFTHLFDEDGACIPTFYAATTLDGAAYETVFRGIPDKFQAVPRQFLDDRKISIVQPNRRLQLVPLFTPELKAWGLDQEKLFAARAEVYNVCRVLAFRCWRDNPEAQGLVWSSVRDSSAHAMLLFGDRLDSNELKIVSSRCVGKDATALNDLERVGVRGGWFISK